MSSWALFLSTVLITLSAPEENFIIDFVISNLFLVDLSLKQRVTQNPIVPKVAISGVSFIIN